MHIKEVAKRAREAAEARGRYENTTVAEILAHVHAEVSEAYTADKKGHRPDWRAFNLHCAEFPDNVDQWFNCFVKDSFDDELADVIILVLGLADKLGIDIERNIDEKMKYNATRTDG